MPITARDRKALVSLIESYGDKALRAVGLAHKDIPAELAAPKTDILKPQDLEQDLVLDAIVVSFFFFSLVFSCLFFSLSHTFFAVLYIIYTKFVMKTRSIYSVV